MPANKASGVIRRTIELKPHEAAVWDAVKAQGQGQGQGFKEITLALWRAWLAHPNIINFDPERSRKGE
jgi:hypothetical protein